MPVSILPSLSSLKTAFLTLPFAPPAPHCRHLPTSRSLLCARLRTTTFSPAQRLRPPRGRRPHPPSRSLAPTSSAPAPSPALTLFRDDIARAEHLFSACVFSHPSGTAALAAARGVDMPLMSRAYGRVLASTIRAEIPVALDAAALAAACEAAGAGHDLLPLKPLEFEAWLARLRAAAARGEVLPDLEDDERRRVSQTYGAIIGRTVRLAALELDFGLLAAALAEGLCDADAGMPLEEAEYNRMFDELQSCAATVLGTSNLENADRFFGALREYADVDDVQSDGFVLAVKGSFEGEGRARAVEVSDTVQVALRARLLDGRALYVPTYSDGEGSEPDYLEAALDALPPALTCVLLGMRPQETKTAFYHPYAAHEVLGMFATSDQTPPQAGLVMDVYLKKVV